MSAKHGRGFFAIGIEHSKTPANVGTLWRTASLYGASFVFTVGHRYKRQASDTIHTERHRPLFHFDTITDLHRHLPKGAPLVGVEMDDSAVELTDYVHRESAVYLLGAEDHGLTNEALSACHDLVTIPCPSPFSMNVAVAGSLVIYDRFMQASHAAAATA